MRVVIIGQKWLAESVLSLCLEAGHVVVKVIAPAGDKIYSHAQRGHIAVAQVAQCVEESHIPENVDLIIAAHAHVFISQQARAKARLGAIGYHPSLLPRHRGRDAVRWTIHMGDKIAGGSVYWMDDGADTGDIAAQDWCHVLPDDTANTLWRRELGPMGVRLLGRVIADAASGITRRLPQDDRVATFEPAFNTGRRLAQ